MMGEFKPDPDPYLWLKDPGGPKTYGSFLCLLRYFLTVPTLHHSSQIKSHRKVSKQEKSRVFLLFLLYDGRIQTGSGSVPLAKGSGRPKNLWILRIRNPVLIYCKYVPINPLFYTVWVPKNSLHFCCRSFATHLYIGSDVMFCIDGPFGRHFQAISLAFN
jgi:hypothetical protein